MKTVLDKLFSIGIALAVVLSPIWVVAEAVTKDPSWLYVYLSIWGYIMFCICLGWLAFHLTDKGKKQ